MKKLNKYKKRALRKLARANHYVDVGAGKIGKSWKRLSRARSKYFKRKNQKDGFAGGLALGMGLPMLLNATQGIMNSKVF